MPMPLAKLTQIAEELIGAGKSASQVSKWKTAAKVFHTADDAEEKYKAANLLTARFGQMSDANSKAKEIHAAASKFQNDMYDPANPFKTVFPARVTD